MYKVGDRVETYKEIRSLKGAGPRHVKGRIVEVHADTLTISFDEPWPYGAMQLVFRLEDLLATDVLRLKVGDKVHTGHGDVATVLSCPSNPGQIAVRLAGGRHTSFYSLSALTKVDDPDEGGQRGQWSFSATKDTFDGARVIRELVETDADYAVVEVNGRRLGLLHDSVARRAVKLQVYKLAGQDWSASPVVDFDLRPRPEVRFGDAPYGYRYVFHEGDGVTTQELAEMVKELEGLEKKAAEEARKRAEAVVATVTWAKADK